LPRTAVFSQQHLPTNIVVENNGEKLQGYFHALYNREGSFPTLILLQGFSVNGSDVFGLGEQLVQSGLNVVTLINSSVTPSEGLFSFDNCISDLEAAHHFVLRPENIAW
jgi:hypothetical protein